MDHSPKTGALMAYESGALSAKGRARIEGHLRTCVVCQRELAAIQSYEATVDAIRDDRGPDLDWSKMELALEREAHVQAKKHRRGWMLPAAGVSMAAAAALWLALPSGPARPTTVADARTYVIDGAPSAPAPRALARAVVTVVAGASAIHSGDVVADAAAGARLTEGDVLETTDASSLHARITSGLGIALMPSTELRIASLDLTAPELALTRGRLATSISQTRTVILAGQYRIEAEVASFVIDFDAVASAAGASALSIDVHDGEVHVTGPGLDERLTGPVHFPTAAAALDATMPVGTSVSYDALPEVRVARDGIVRWQLGDTGAVGSDRMAMRMGMGPTTISGWDAHGRMFHASVTVGVDGLDLSPDELVPEAPRVHQGVLAIEDIIPVVHQHQGQMQSCYEHALRTSPTMGEVHITARISIEMTGSVADDGVRFSGDAIPEAMATCLSQRIETWIFPAPTGGPVAVPIPIGFSPR